MQKVNHTLKVIIDEELFDLILQKCNEQNINPSKFIRQLLKDNLKGGK